MTPEEYEECCVRNWCLENSMVINKFGTVDKIIDDARKLHKFVTGKPDCKIVNIKKGKK